MLAARPTRSWLGFQLADNEQVGSARNPYTQIFLCGMSVMEREADGARPQ